MRCASLYDFSGKQGRLLDMSVTGKDRTVNEEQNVIIIVPAKGQ